MNRKYNKRKSVKTIAGLAILLFAFRGFAGAPQSFPRSFEILESVKGFLRDFDREGLRLYVENLYAGSGTNYVPAIALSGWHDRMFLGDFNSSKRKYARLQSHAQANATISGGIIKDISILDEDELTSLSLRTNLPLRLEIELRKIFFQEDLRDQIGFLERDFYRNGNKALRLVRKDGYAGMVRDTKASFGANAFTEISRFLRFAPSVFITNLEASAAASLDAANKWALRRMFPAFASNHEP